MVIVCLRKVTQTPSHRCIKNIAVSSGECEISDAPHSDSLDMQWAMSVGDKVILDSSKHAYIDSVHARNRFCQNLEPISRLKILVQLALSLGRFMYTVARPPSFT